MLLLLLIPVAFLAGCSNAGAERGITSISQLNDSSISIGVSADTDQDELVKKEFPKAQIQYFKDEISGYMAVSQGKISAYVHEKIVMEIAVRNGFTGVRVLDETIGEPIQSAAAISPKTSIPNLKEKINAFLDASEKDGTMADLKSRWIDGKDMTMPALPVPQSAETHLVVATAGVNMPFSYFIGEELAGYDIELATRFAISLGASMEFKIYDFDGIVTAALEGDVDCIFSNLFITEERKESIAFSNPTYTSEIGVMVGDASNTSKYNHLDDLENASFGVLTGSNLPEHVQKRFPNATLMYYNNTSDAIGALLTGKVDAVAIDEPVGRNVVAQYPETKAIPELLEALDYAFIFSKDASGSQRAEDVSVFINKLQGDGTLDSLQKKWFDNPDLTSIEMLDYRTFPGTKGTFKLAFIQNPPFAFSQESLYAGYDIEIVAMYCQQAGYALEITDVSMDAIISNVITGKVDSACGGITATDERKESMNFSAPVYSGGTAVLVLSGDASQSDKGFFAAIADAFDKTFIRENRWKLFLYGILTTLLITALSIVFGTALGFVVFLLCRKGNKVANVIARFFVWLIQGMPAVVLLMILYYIVFGSVSIAGEAVSTIGFTLIFGSGVFNMLKGGVNTVDKGQTEAALALGYRDNKAFFRIIFPQAIPHMLPTYKGEITSLIKATAIVGYVAVQDVTKIGDIIRSRTFEPFFPLITTAIIYFLLAGILIFLVKRVEIQLNPKRKKQKKLLKGVVQK